MTVAIVEIAQQRTVRLIPTANYKPPVLRALVDSDAEADQLARLEMFTSKRVNTPSLTGDYTGWGMTYINAAFVYTRRGGNRFNGEDRGAWYAGFEDRTALTEVAFHKTRELAFIDHFYDEVEYNALHASFIGRFHDLRGSDPRHASLDPDPEIGYPAGQGLAASLRRNGGRGLIYPSVRHRGGTCLVAFEPNVVQDVTPGARWRLRWTGSCNWEASPV